MERNKYKTSDLGLAAAIMSLGYRIERLDPGTKNNQVIFVFNEYEGPKEIEDLYKTINPGLKVDAYNYFASIRELKIRIFNHKLNSGQN